MPRDYRVLQSSNYDCVVENVKDKALVNLKIQCLHYSKHIASPS